MMLGEVVSATRSGPVSAPGPGRESGVSLAKMAVLSRTIVLTTGGGEKVNEKIEGKRLQGQGGSTRL